MSLIPYLRYSYFRVQKDVINNFEGDFENYLKECLVSNLSEEIKKIITIEKQEGYPPYVDTFRASVVIIPIDEATEIQRKLKRLEELERQYVADND